LTFCGYLAILFPAICRAAPRPESGDNDADVDWFAEYQRLAGQDTGKCALLMKQSRDPIGRLYSGTTSYIVS
jgi:hypothetical protein